MKERDPRQPPALLSAVPIAVLVALLFFTIRIFGADALGGPSQVALLAAAGVGALIAVGWCRVGWSAIEESISRNIRSVGVPIVILLLIGALSGSWMISGVVPTLIYYGLEILHPSFFLVSCCVICCVVSVMTGSSWTTVATIGVALMGIGTAQGFSPGWVAGAIISGAYFGDKVSPLSDTTVLASSVTGTPLFTHIRFLMITTVPSIIITLVIFTIAGLTHHAPAVDRAGELSSGLAATFRITPWVLIVPAVTGVMIARRAPAVVTLFVSALLAGVFAVIFQPDLLLEIAGGGAGDGRGIFKGMVMNLSGPTGVDTGSAAVNDLVSTGGMAGMLDTVWLIICAMCFGGVMLAGGMLQSISALFARVIKRRAGLVASTTATGLLLNVTTADQYMSIILLSNLWGDVYRKAGYESRLLSRTAEDSITVTSVLVPWNSCGMTQATILGVGTLTYLPYCFFNIISPLMTILVAAIGYKILRVKSGN
jgi:NhaC family Na+:H+ antiporter